jgi:type I restriction enzyme, S subunit
MSDDGKFPIVTSGGIAAYHSEYKATGPGVIVGRSGSIGKVFYVEENFWPHNTALYVRDFKGNYPRYVYYYLLSFKAAQFSKSTAVPTLNRNNLRGVQVDVPSFDEQKQIVFKIEELMRLCDELEERQQAKVESRGRLNAAILAPLNKAASLTLAELDRVTTRLTDNFDTLYDSIDTVGKLRATILQLAVQGKLVSHDRRDESAAVLLNTIAQQRQKLLTPSELKKVEPERPSDHSVLPFRAPEGWEWTKLGKISTKLGAGSTPLGGKNVYQEEGVKFLRSQNVWDYGLELDNVAYISEMIHENMNGTHVQDGDILLNITGASIGRSCVVPEHFGDANVSQHVCIIRLVDKRLRFFIHLCIISPYVQDSIMKTQVGISREGLSMKNLKEFLLPIPPLAEQERIVAKVNQLMSLCDELEAKLRQAEADSEKLMNAAVKHVLESVRSVSNTEEVFA